MTVRRRPLFETSKRLFDIAASAAALAVLGLPLTAIAVAIKLDSRGPVLFRQRRIGKDRQEFEILKFRTMRTDTPDVPTHLLQDPSAFITRVGAFLRKTSLDELPQLVNILKGEMSFVGPRPALWNQDDLVAEREKYGANDIVPGLTGWAQINGRDELPIDVKARLDGDYVRDRGWLKDITCLVGTVSSVLRSDGVSEGGPRPAPNLARDGDEPPRMRVAMITQWYDPEALSAATAGVIARGISGKGHDVHVVTGFPNYPTGVIYPGYRQKRYLRETSRGVTVHRGPLYASHDGNPVRRAANFLSYALSGSWTALRRLPTVDVAYVHSTPATAAIPALALKRFRGVPFVLHIQDLWPDTVLHSGKVRRGLAARIVARLLHAFCDHVYQEASAIAVTSPGQSDLIQLRGVPAKKITWISNWADEEVFEPEAKDPALARSLGIDFEQCVMYAGTFGHFTQLDTFIEAADILRDEAALGFVLCGGGIEETALRNEVQERSLDNVVFVEPQPMARMSRILALGDLAYVALQDQPLFRATIPSKLIATLASGRPIVSGLTGDAGRLVTESGAGVTVAPGSATELAEAIEALLADQDRLDEMSRRARSYYETELSKRASMDRLDALLRTSATNRRRS